MTALLAIIIIKTKVCHNTCSSISNNMESERTFFKAELCEVILSVVSKYNESARL